MSVLHEVAACGDTDKLEDLLAQTRNNKNEKDEDWDGRTPLLWATIEGHLSCVKLLLEAGANPTLRNNDEKTAAHYAAESGRCDILKAVLEYGCDATVTDKYGDTAMDYALLYGHLECADLLNKALKGEFHFKITPQQWSKQQFPPKPVQPDLRKRKTLLSLLSGMKKHGDDGSSDGRATPTKRKKRLSGK